MKSPPRAIIYARFSPRRDPEHCMSIERQLDLCREYCASHGYGVEAVFEDRATSGAAALLNLREEARPGLWEALDLLKRGGVLVTYHADRLARDVFLSEYIHRCVEKVGATIEHVQGGAVQDTPEGALQRQILASFAEYQRKLIAIRTKYAMLRHQRNGRLMGSQAPYGYREGEAEYTLQNGTNRRVRRIVPDAEEQAIIDLIRGYHLQGRGMRDIARELNRQGLLCRGNAWLHTGVMRVLKRDFGSRVAPTTDPAV